MKLTIASLITAIGLLSAVNDQPQGRPSLQQVPERPKAPFPGTSSNLISAENQPPIQLDRTPRVSLLAIIANPEKFHGKQIQIEALVSYGHDQFVLAPDPFNMTYSTGASLVHLDVTRCDKREELRKHGNPAVCYLRGTVDAHDPGPAEYPPKACTFRASECQFVVPVAKQK